MQAVLLKQCEGQHIHCPLEGSAPALSRRIWLPAWSCSHNCSCYLCPWPCSVLGLWTCNLWTEGGHRMSAQDPTGLESEVVRTVQGLHRNLQVIEAARHPMHCMPALQSDQTKWYLRRCDIKPVKLVNACRPRCCGSSATPISRISSFSMSWTRPPSTLWRGYLLLHRECGDHLIQGLERA